MGRPKLNGIGDAEDRDGTSVRVVAGDALDYECGREHSGRLVLNARQDEASSVLTGTQDVAKRRDAAGFRVAK